MKACAMFLALSWAQTARADSWPATIERGGSTGRAVEIRVEKEGRLRVVIGDGAERSTLEDLGRYLIKAARLYDEEQQRIGRRGYEDPPERGISRLTARITVDADAPWQHVCWVVVVCFENRFVKFELCCGDSVVSMRPEPDSSKTHPDIAPERGVRVGVSADGHIEARWSNARAEIPRAIAYKVEGEHAKDLAGALRRVRREIDGRCAKDDLVGIVKADPEVPAGHVIGVLDALLEAGIRRLDFRPIVQIPPKTERVRDMLRHPRELPD